MNAMIRGLSLSGMWLLAASPASLMLAQEPAPDLAAGRDKAVSSSANGSAEATSSESAQVSAPAVNSTASSPRKSSAGRLPPYFAALVDNRQRETIYQIRAAMAVKIATLEKQLEELRQAEMREIEAVLSDGQRQQLETLRASRTSKPAPLGT